jgi:GT2 family glycosyltransferase
MKSLSVVIPSYDGAETLGSCLSALGAELVWSRDEVIVVDSSKSALPADLLQRFPKARWERHTPRLFPGSARNIGARLARGEWIAFVDADIVVQPGWREAVEALPDGVVAAAGPVDAAKPQTRWGLARYWIEFGQFATANLPRQSWNVPSCNMIWQRPSFLETGGFPESFQSSDDLLFNYQQMKLRGRQFVMIPQLSVLHPANCSMQEAERHLRKLGYWSGRARAEGVRPGVGDTVLALPALFCYRCCQVWLRSLRQDAPPGLIALESAVARGVAWWCLGYFRGVGENRA